MAKNKTFKRVKDTTPALIGYEFTREPIREKVIKVKTPKTKKGDMTIQDAWNQGLLRLEGKRLTRFALRPSHLQYKKGTHQVAVPFGKKIQGTTFYVKCCRCGVVREFELEPGTSQEDMERMVGVCFRNGRGCKCHKEDLFRLQRTKTKRHWGYLWVDKDNPDHDARMFEPLSDDLKIK